MNSVVIPTYNRSKSLLRTLNSLICQTVLPNQYEILVIDDGSTDDTRKIIADFQLSYPNYNIRYFYQTNHGSASAKNLGIKKSLGETIFFTDDDCIVPKNWMETLLAGYRRYPNAVGVGGWHIPPGNENRFFQKTAYKIDLLFNSSYAKEEKLIENFTSCVALIPNVSYKKDILEKIGGFDKKISALGSVELKYRVMVKEKKHILSMPIAVVHNCSLGSLGYLKKLFKQGRCKQYENFKYFNGKPPSNFDLTFKEAPKKLFVYFSQIWSLKNVKFSDLPAIFVFFALAVFFNTLGGYYERCIIKCV